MLENYGINEHVVTNKNLISLSKEQSRLEERRICELAELTASLIDGVFEAYGDDMDVYEILSLLSEDLTIAKGAMHPESITENRERLSAYLETVSESDRIVFCDLMVEKLASRGIVVSESDFLFSGSPNEIIAYVKNAFADEAYDVFSEELSDPRVIYESSLKAAVSSVIDGVASYCLLPLEEGGGSRLHSVEQLIFSCDLKINSVTPVFGFDGTADIKYALLSKAFRLSTPDDRDDRYLEIRIPAADTASLSELLTVVEWFGHSIYRVNTSTLDFMDGSRVYYTIVIRDEGREFTRLLSYLTLFTGAFVAVGLYKNLE